MSNQNPFNRDCIVWTMDTHSKLLIKSGQEISIENAGSLPLLLLCIFLHRNETIDKNWTIAHRISIFERNRSNRDGKCESAR